MRGVVVKLGRREFLHLAGTAIAVSPCPVRALDYPTRPVRVIVGFPAGGQQDIMARLIAQWLSERLGQQVLVDNRSGAGGNIGAEAAANAAPDGHTLLLVGSPNAINATLYDKPGFVFQRDIVPVAGIARTPLIAEVHPSVPVRTLPEFIAYAKANPGRLSYASAGNGTSQHFAVELLKLMSGVNMLHVPYRGVAPALVDLLAGHVQFMIDPLPASLPHVRTGALRPLAVTTMARYSALPDLPTVHEFIPGYEADFLVRDRCAARHPARRDRHAQPRDQRRACQCGRRGAHRGTRRRGCGGIAGRFRHHDRRGDREVGQGREDDRYQGRISR